MALGHRPFIAMRDPRSKSAGSLTSRQSYDFDELYVEHERRIRRNRRRSAPLAVGVLGRQEEIAPPADPQAVDALFPAANHSAGAELKGERLPAPRAVELRTAPVAGLRIVEPARVVHDRGVAAPDRVAAARFDLDHGQLLELARRQSDRRARAGRARPRVGPLPAASGEQQDGGWD